MAKVLVLGEGGIYSTFEQPLGYATRPSLTVSQTIERLLKKLPVEESNACREIYAVGEIASLDLKELLTAPPLDPKLALSSLKQTVLDVGLEFTYFDGISYRGEIEAENGLGWLPFQARSGELADHLANSNIYRQRVPETEREEQFEHALAREKILALLSSETEDSFQEYYDEILLTGAVFSQGASLGKSLLIALDTLPLQGATRFVLDNSQILVSLAALNYFRPEFLDNFDLSTLLDTQLLGTVITMPGKLAVELDLGLDSNQQIVVPADTILKLFLNKEQSGTLSVSSSQGYTLETEFTGGSLGLIFDTRNKPLVRPAPNRLGRQKVAGWQKEITK